MTSNAGLAIAKKPNGHALTHDNRVLTHSNDNRCLSCICDYQDIQFAKLSFFNYYIIFQLNHIVEGFLNFF